MIQFGKINFNHSIVKSAKKNPPEAMFNQALLDVLGYEQPETKLVGGKNDIPALDMITPENYTYTSKNSVLTKEEMIKLETALVQELSGLGKNSGISSVEYIA